jgi:large conductance mechanosensitive channel protein
MEKVDKIKKIKKIRGLSGFRQFLKNQGVVTLAIGFILGTAISKFVSSLVTDIMNPLLSAALGGVDDLNSKVIHLDKSTIHYGLFLNSGIDFIVIALVVYTGVKLFGLDQENIGKMDVGKINSLNGGIVKK